MSQDAAARNALSNLASLLGGAQKPQPVNVMATPPASPRPGLAPTAVLPKSGESIDALAGQLKTQVQTKGIENAMLSDFKKIASKNGWTIAG